MQIGNEGGNGIAPLSGDKAARAFIQLDAVLKKVWSGADAAERRPLLMGPDGGVYFSSILALF